MIIVYPFGGSPAGMHVAVHGVKLELILNNRQKLLGHLDHQRRFRSIAAVPCSQELAIPFHCHSVNVPELIYSCYISKINIWTIPVSQLFLQNPAVFDLGLISPFARGSLGAECITLASISPHGFVIDYYQFRNAITMYFAPMLSILATVANAMG